jgi:hypothetical protein
VNLTNAKQGFRCVSFCPLWSPKEHSRIRASAHALDWKHLKCSTVRPVQFPQQCVGQTLASYPACRQHRLEFLTQRESFTLGYPYLHVHLVIFSFNMPAIHSRRFAVHRFLAQIAASYLGVVLVFFLVLEHVLWLDCAPSPAMVQPDVNRTAGINRLRRRGLATGAESVSSGCVNVSRRCKHLTPDVGQRLGSAIRRLRKRGENDATISKIARTKSVEAIERCIEIPPGTNYCHFHSGLFFCHVVPDAKPSSFRSVWKNDERVTSKLLAHVHDRACMLAGEPRCSAVLPLAADRVFCAVGPDLLAVAHAVSAARRNGVLG